MIIKKRGRVNWINKFNISYYPDGFILDHASSNAVKDKLIKLRKDLLFYGFILTALLILTIHSIILYSNYFFSIYIFGIVMMLFNLLSTTKERKRFLKLYNEMIVKEIIE